MNNLKRIILSFILVGVTLAFYSCDKDEPNSTPTPANRTILVYIVATNSLGYANNDLYDINEMLEASKYNDFNNGRLIIYHATIGQKTALKEIKQGKIHTLKEYDQSVSSVDPQRMQQVINDTKKIAPANDYGLILWSHANGWLQTGDNATISIKQTKKPLAFGVEYGKHMNITTLARVINDENFSFIYFDCCNMASIEVAYELRHATPYIIASATEVPSDGMPYEQNIPLLFSDSNKLKDVCINTFDFYNCQSGWQRTCTISLIKTDFLDELAQATASIYSDFNTLPNGFSPQRFILDATCYFFDLEHYVKALIPENHHLLNQWLDILDKVVIYKAATPQLWEELDLTHHCGLSTYILDNNNNATTHGYNQLEWYNDVASKLFTNK